MLQGTKKFIDENSIETRDRFYQRQNLQSICQQLMSYEVSRNASSSFNFTLPSSNSSSSSYLLNELLYHRTRFASRNEFEIISSEHRKFVKFYHVNTKVLKALCIKGKTSGFSVMSNVYKKNLHVVLTC